MTRPAQPGTTVLDFRNAKLAKSGNDVPSQSSTANHCPLPTMSSARSPYPTMIDPRLRVQTATDDPSDKENQDTLSQNMRKSARKQ